MTNLATLSGAKLPRDLLISGVVERVRHKIEAGEAPRTPEDVVRQCELPMSDLRQCFNEPILSSIFEEVGSRLCAELLRVLRAEHRGLSRGGGDWRSEIMGIVDAGYTFLLAHQRTVNLLMVENGRPLLQIKMSTESREEFERFWKESMKQLQASNRIGPEVELKPLAMACSTTFWNLAPAWLKAPVNQRDDQVEFLIQLLSNMRTVKSTEIRKPQSDSD